MCGGQTIYYNTISLLQLDHHTFAVPWSKESIRKKVFTNYVIVGFSNGFYDKNLKSKMTGQWRYYSGNLQKICNIIGPIG